MSKPKRDDDGLRKITISTGDEAPEPNGTLLALLRDGESPRPGEPGTLADRLGAEVQAFFAGQLKVARHLRRGVKGTVSLTITVATGPDGSQMYGVESKTKGTKIPAGVSMKFTGDDGELTNQPVSPLEQEMYRREKAAQGVDKGASAEPMAGKPSNL